METREIISRINAVISTLNNVEVKRVENLEYMRNSIRFLEETINLIAENENNEES